MRLIFFILMMAGFGLALYSTTIPAYTNLIEKEKWDSRASKKLGHSGSNKFRKRYYREVSKLRTNKYDFLDIGTGTALFAITLLLFSFFFKIKNSRDLFRIRSPKRWAVFLISNIVWLGFIPANFLFYTLNQSRGSYPWFADSIAIPIFNTAIVVIILLPILNIVIALFIYHSKLPAPLLARFPKYTFFPILLELIFGFFLIILLLGLFELIISGDIIGTPICIIFIYLLLSLRAGKIKWRIEKQEN